MSEVPVENGPLAIVSGSHGVVGGALVERLRREGWRVATIDPSGTPSQPAATFGIDGDLTDAATWQRLRARIEDEGVAPRAFIHALSGFASPDVGRAGEAPAGVIDPLDILRSAEIGCEAILPTMDGGAIVLLASVLAGWDTRAGTAAYSAAQAGLLALSRSLALDGAARNVRINAVCVGLVGDDDGNTVPPGAARERIPLGGPARPDDVVDVVRFFLSEDARFITGSSLVVDGGESLQSWSNAPRTAGAQRLAEQPGAEAARADDHVGPEKRDRRPRTVLITGAAGGLGSAAARRFGAEGARLVLLDRDHAAVTAFAAELTGRGWEVLPLTADVTDERSMADAFAAAEAHFGSLDVVFNNAGVGSRDFTIANMPVAEWDDVIAINLRGVFLGCKYAVPALARAGGGAIVNMGSSTARHDTITGGAVYMASKAGVEALTKSLALQVAPLGIRANTIAPGIIQTQLSFRQQERGDAASFFAEFAARIPLGRVGQPDDVAAAVAFLASDQARHVTGATLLIDGGQTLRRWISAPDVVSPAT